MKKAPLISVRDLVVRYGDHLVLDKVSFDVLEGEILCILGASGCGKTTLIRHIMGLESPRAGNIVIDGVDITNCDDQVFRKTLRKIGILFQSSALFGSMTLAENVALPIEEYSGLPRLLIQDLVKMKLCRVDLSGFENYQPHEISGGMKKRAGLARALALNPKILFLDEPSAGLDPITAAEIDELILHINQNNGTTIVIVTHELASIFALAKRVIMLDKNKKGIIAQGDPTTLKQRSSDSFVRNFFSRQTRAEFENRP